MRQHLILFLLIQLSNLCFSEELADCGKIDDIDPSFETGPHNDDEINPAGNWPWMASIGYYDDNKKWNHKCGATLITNRLFLTAAHCVSSQFNLIRIGDSNHTSDKDDRNAIDLEILNSTVHPDFDTVSSYYDIALLLTKNVTFSRFIRPICLPDFSSDNINKYDDKHVELIGWGKNLLNGKISEKLKRVSLRIYSIRHCNATYSKATLSTEKIISKKLPQLFQSHILCAGAPTVNQGSCKGDSGGPLMYLEVEENRRWVQVALDQGAVRDCEDVDFPGMYIRLDDPLILNFINSTIYTLTNQEDIVDTDFEENYDDSGIYFFSEEVRCEKTNSEGPKKFEICVFPFKFKINHVLRTFDACINLTDQEGKYWCSTKVNAEGIHQSGHWGYCDPNCNITEIVSRSTTTTATSISTTSAEETSDYEIDVNYDSSELPEEDSEKDLFCGSDRSEGFRRRRRQDVSQNNVKLGTYPFIAALGVVESNRPEEIIYICVGSLINRRYVLTAAHCQSEKSPIVSVRLGEHDYATDPDCAEEVFSCKSILQEFSIKPKDVIVHEKFDVKNFDVGFDIALIRLPRLAITVNEDPRSRVDPICLPWKIPLPKTDIHFVAGWGQNITNKFDSGKLFSIGSLTSILQQLQVPILPFEECVTKLQDKRITNENHICAGGEKGRDSCIGDSGGPLVVKTSEEVRTLVMYLEGIVSFRSETCKGGTPGVYTRVATFIPWIIANLKP